MVAEALEIIILVRNRHPFTASKHYIVKQNNQYHHMQRVVSGSNVLF